MGIENSYPRCVPNDCFAWRMDRYQEPCDDAANMSRDNAVNMSRDNAINMSRDGIYTVSTRLSECHSCNERERRFIKRLSGMVADECVIVQMTIDYCTLRSI